MRKRIPGQLLTFVHVQNEIGDIVQLGFSVLVQCVNTQANYKTNNGREDPT